jgi:hypothetical protein
MFGCDSDGSRVANRATAAKPNGRRAALQLLGFTRRWLASPVIVLPLLAAAGWRRYLRLLDLFQLAARGASTNPACRSPDEGPRGRFGSESSGPERFHSTSSAFTR